MDAQRLKQIEEIYHEILETTPDERQSVLGKICNTDKDLLREIESLLSYESDFDSFLDTPPEFLVAEMFADQVNHKDLIGKNIRRYKIH